MEKFKKAIYEIKKALSLKGDKRYNREVFVAKELSVKVEYVGWYYEENPVRVCLSAKKEGVSIRKSGYYPSKGEDIGAMMMKKYMALVEFLSEFDEGNLVEWGEEGTFNGGNFHEPMGVYAEITTRNGGLYFSPLPMGQGGYCGNSYHPGYVAEDVDWGGEKLLLQVGRGGGRSYSRYCYMKLTSS